MKIKTLYHIGILRRSGRYPWGSGGKEHNFLTTVEKLAEEGLSEKEIADALKMPVSKLRSKKALSRGELTEMYRKYILNLRDQGMSFSEIAKVVDLPERTVSSMVKKHHNMKYRIVKAIAEKLRWFIDKYGVVDVGVGTNVLLNVSTTQLDQAIELLEGEGYTRHDIYVKQLGTNKNTTVKVLAAPGMTLKDVLAQKENIRPPVNLDDFETNDVADDFKNMVQLPRERVKVVKSEYDGLIEVRAGVPDLSLGGRKYAQTRILVEGGKFAKGMVVPRKPDEAPFKDLPPGVDVVVHVSKEPSYSSLKDWEGDGIPFKASYTPVYTTLPNGQKVRSAINVIREAGDWNEWNRISPSQFLSKQPVPLIKRQLDLSRKSAAAQMEIIENIKNPMIRADMFRSLADGIDKKTTTLEAAAMPKQYTSVLIPSDEIPKNTVFAPNYKTGEVIALVRYPHAGPFEIPLLTVNNNIRKLRESILPDSDAIVVHPEVAKQLSGADFDGDTVVTMAYNSRNPIRASKPYQELLDFDPRIEYPYVEGMPIMTKGMKGLEMGRVSNLITDMSIQNAPPEDIIKAVKHSMVVIDAEKHKLNYKQSERDHGIPALIKKYQGRGGASTIVSKAKSPIYVDERDDRYLIDPDTGEKIYIQTGRTYVKKDGTVVKYKTTTYKMAEAKDAYSLVRDKSNPVEVEYAEHANAMKKLANEARLKSLAAQKEKITVSNDVKKQYEPEVRSLKNKLEIAQMNAPKERAAQILAGQIYKDRTERMPLSREQRKTERARALRIARKRLGAKKPQITLTDKEWEAIEAGALTKTMSQEIMKHVPSKEVYERVVKRATLPPVSESLVRSLKQTHTNREIAEMLNLPVSVIEGVKNNG